MPPSNLTADDQFRFLISCIRNTTNSKVDFIKVAEECKIVSKGAASKRYERLLKAHGCPTISSLHNKSRKRRTDENSSDLKRKKGEEFREEDAAIDDEEAFNKNIKNEIKTEINNATAKDIKLETADEIKPEPFVKKEEVMVKKEEHTQHHGLRDVGNHMQFFDAPASPYRSPYSSGPYNGGMCGSDNGRSADGFPVPSHGAAYNLNADQFGFGSAYGDCGYGAPVPYGYGGGMHGEELKHVPDEVLGASDSPVVLD